MICRIKLLVHSGWYCLSSGALLRMVQRCWKSKVRLVWVSCPSPFSCLCCAFWGSLAGCARWCSNLPALLSHRKPCEFPGIRTRPCPCQMIQLSCLTSSSWLLCWIGVLKDQSQTLLLLVQMASWRLRVRVFHSTFSVLHTMQITSDSLWCKKDYSRANRFGANPVFYSNMAISQYPHTDFGLYMVMLLFKNQEGSIITLTESYVIGNGTSFNVKNHLQSQIGK